MFLFIAIGTVPIIGDAFLNILGPIMILAGLVLVYKSAADLGNNLSPWPKPSAGRGSVIKEGVYAYVRHPLYTGCLVGMTGLSIVTDSATRMLLTLALYFVFDVKSTYEEQKMTEAYGLEYEDYMSEVEGKFIPPDMMNGLFKRE